MYRRFKQETANPFPILPPIQMGCGQSTINEEYTSLPQVSRGDVVSNLKTSNGELRKNEKDYTKASGTSRNDVTVQKTPPQHLPPPNDVSKTKKFIKRTSNIGSFLKREKTNVKISLKKVSRKVYNFTNPTLDRYTELILRGKVSLDCPPTAKIVRIFTSSTFTDTRHERNYLMEKTYPKLKEFCQDLGYEFQVVDMRWGVRDEATDDHMTTELCLREVDLCNKLSTGPSFVTFLSHKYGYRDFPREIDASEYDKMLATNLSEELQELLNGWYKKDDNSVPPSYILQPISSRLPDFKSDNEEKKKEAKMIWTKQCEQMREAIVKAAKQIMDADATHKYLRSVTEAEVDRGVAHGGKRAFWFDRNIIGIEKQKPSEQLRRYKECFGTDEYLTESGKLLKNLKDELKSRLPNNHIRQYPTNWEQSGIDPTSHKSHQIYIQKLAGEFEETIKGSVLQAIHEKQISSLNTPLYQEVFQHTAFCQEKVKAFYGRKDTFDIINNYMERQNNEPLIIHGESGCGKTSIVAMAAQNAWTDNPENMTVIIRFLGTTPDSSNIGALLTSITNQIKIVYNQEEIASDLTLKELSAEFERTLHIATQDRPLLVLLDSLDQLDITGGARQLFWLPRELPEHVKMIVSTLPEVEYECFPRLQAMFPDTSFFLPVATLSNDDVEGILEKWLESKQRQLQDPQLQILLKAFQQCPLPLFLKLSFDEACRWKSYTSPDLCVLKTTVRTIITDLFIRVESLHGRSLVERSLGYLTLSAGGLTEAELEDILSCDEDVLNDVYTYWTPPVRRLPPLLLIRIKAELGQYFVDRGTDGVRVFYWYHRQFIEAATDRYCSDDNIKQKMHRVLADFFSGVWANGKQKPYTTKSGENSASDRYVASQPIKLGKSFNLRKLNNLPHHRLQANQQDLLKSECLCNFDFMLNKLKASGLRPLLDDFSSALQTYSGDDDIRTICEALQLSQRALQYNADELPSQILGRIKPTPGLQQFIDDCKHSPFYYLMPNKSILIQPGGSLKYCLSNHTNDVYGLDISKSGEFAASCAYDKTIKIWSVKRGKLVNSFGVDGTDPENVKFCNFDKTLVVSCDDAAVGINFQTGIHQYKIKWESKESLCVGGNDKELLGLFANISVKVHDSNTGVLLSTVECEFLNEALTFGSYCPCVGQGRYMATTDDESYKVLVFDTVANKFLHMTNIFDPSIDEDGDNEQNTVDAMVITPDEKHVIVSTMMVNDLLVYDINTMEKIRVIKGNEKDSCDKYNMTADGQYLYFPYHNEIVAFDMNTEERFIAIHHPTNVENVVTIDMNIVVTAGDDRIVRIWDRSRTDGDTEKENLKKNRTVYLSELTGNSRFTVNRCKDGEENVLEIYDLSKDSAIKRFKISGPYKTIFMDGTRFLLCSSKTVAVVDLNTGDIVRMFQDVLPKRASTDIKLCFPKKLFCVFSRGRHNVKIYNIETGDCEIIEGCGQRMEDMVINETFTRLASSINNSEEIVFFDLEKKEVLYTYKAGMILNGTMNDSLYINDAILTDDCRFFIHQHDMIPPCFKGTKSSTNVSLIIVWDIELKKTHQILCDDEYVKKYDANEDDDSSYDVNEVKLFKDSQLISSHDDYIIRIFDYLQGTLLHRLPGHFSNIELVVRKNSPFFISYATWSEENSLKLWDTETLECLASYCLESPFDNPQITADDYQIIASEKKKYPIVFELRGGEYNQKYEAPKDMYKYDDLFTPSEIINEIVLPDSGEDTTDDIDQDPIEVSETESEDEQENQKDATSDSSISLDDFDFSDSDLNLKINDKTISGKL